MVHRTRVQRTGGAWTGIAIALVGASVVATGIVANQGPAVTLDSASEIESALTREGIDTECSWRTKAAFVSVVTCDIAGEEAVFGLFDEELGPWRQRALARAQADGPCLIHRGWVVTSQNPDLIPLVQSALGGEHWTCVLGRLIRPPFDPKSRSIFVEP